MNALLAAIADFFRHAVETGRDERVLVAFSGGPDSTALLAALARLGPELEIEPVAAHLDHGLDPDSPRRAREAAEIARRLGVPIVVESSGGGSGAGAGLEAEARERRYAFLERQADALGARWIATAHHADDQAETVLLRLLFGSGLEGLAAIRPRRGRVVRPLLGLAREGILEGFAELRAELPGGEVLEPILDPTNADLGRPRNRLRHGVMPVLERREPGLSARLARLAGLAEAANRRLARYLGDHLRLAREETGRAAVDRRRFEALPSELAPHALALMHRAAGRAYPAPASARSELLRQLALGLDRPGCDCGDGWRWEADGEKLRVGPPQPSPGDFTYTVSVPGEVELPELGLKLCLENGDAAPWMWRGRPDRAGLAARLEPGSRVEVRNRRRGDRLRPLGGGNRRLKDLLIDHRVPRHERDRLPLLVIDGEIAWVPGITIGERFRLDDGSSRVWIASLESLSPESFAPSGGCS